MHIVAAEQKRQVANVGFYRIRPPLKPLTLSELASLELLSRCDTLSRSCDRTS